MRRTKSVDEHISIHNSPSNSVSRGNERVNGTGYFPPDLTPSGDQRLGTVSNDAVNLSYFEALIEHTFPVLDDRFNMGSERRM